jgi:hypothetical protein
MSLPRRSPFAAALLAALLACGESEDEEEGPLMAPGQDCLSCHGEFTLAGTVFPSVDAAADQGLEGLDVVVVPSSGPQFTLTSNAAGNFYTTQAIDFPVRVTITDGMGSAEMMDATGACNDCHGAGSRITFP